MRSSWAVATCISAGAALALSACAPAPEQPPPAAEPPAPEASVAPEADSLDVLLRDKRIKLRVKDGKIKATPRAIHLCKRNGDCNTVTWEFDKTDEDRVKKLQIRRTKYTQDGEKCFSAATYTLVGEGAEESATVQGDCPDKSAWIYDVYALCAGDEECEGIDPLDPGMIIGD